MSHECGSAPGSSENRSSSSSSIQSRRSCASAARSNSSREPVQKFPRVVAVDEQTPGRFRLPPIAVESHAPRAGRGAEAHVELHAGAPGGVRAHRFGATPQPEDLLHEATDALGQTTAPERTDVAGLGPARPTHDAQPREGFVPAEFQIPAGAAPLERLVVRRTLAEDALRLHEPRLEVAPGRVCLDAPGDPQHLGQTLVRWPARVEIAPDAPPQVHALPHIEGMPVCIHEDVDARGRGKIGHPFRNRRRARDRETSSVFSSVFSRPLPAALPAAGRGMSDSGCLRSSGGSTAASRGSARFGPGVPAAHIRPP